MSVSFAFDEEKASAAVVYLASKGIPDLTKGKLCKLIFLADKHHLVRFGRTVTGDRVCAMKDGPVPSAILDMLNSIILNQATSAHRVLADNVVVERRFTNPHFASSQFDLGDLLSLSDIEALDSVVEAHGRKTFAELRNMTHQMPAYINAWDERGLHNSPSMDFVDFFEEDDEAIDGASEEMIENSKLRAAFAGIVRS